jgi:hypothetical protein
MSLLRSVGGKSECAMASTFHLRMILAASLMMTKVALPTLQPLFQTRPVGIFFIQQRFLADY